MKIMFVCTGNICRSAMAHWLMKKKLEDNNISRIDVYSCGIFAENGDYSTYEAIDTMEEYGVDIEKHRATNIRNAPLEEMDLILCATTNHKNAILQMYPDLQGKVYTMKEYAGDKELNIKDPWGYGIETYRMCAAEIDETLNKILEKIK